MAYEHLWATQSGYLTNGQLNKKFQKAAQPLTKFRQFCAVKEAFGKHKGESVNWLKVANVGTYGGSLTETQTMHETTQQLSWGTVSVNEYGNAIPFTFKVEALSEFDIEEIIREGLLDDFAKVVDSLVEREFNKTPLVYMGTATDGYQLGTATTASYTNTSALVPYHFINILSELKKRNVPGYSGLGGDYVCIMSPACMASFLYAVQSVNQYVETGYKMILNGEVGRFYGCRIVEDFFASYNYISSRSATTVSWTQSKSGPAYFFGSPTVREAVAVPEEIRMKVPSDYGRSKGLAWYFLGGFAIEWAAHADSRIVKWASAA